MRSIKQGVNERIFICLDFDPSIIEELQLSFFQQGAEVVRKGMADCRIDGTTIMTELSADETLLFSPQRFAVTLRGKYPDGGTVMIENLPCVVGRGEYREGI